MFRSRNILTILLSLLLVSTLVWAEAPKEDCISFNPNQAKVKKVNGRWKVVVGRMLLLDFANKRGEAYQALKVIQNYNLDQQCFVGRPDPSLEYYLSKGKAPTGQGVANEDCISFNPQRIQVKKINGRWKIVEGSHWILDFNRNEAEARKSFAILKKYGFNRICFVGRPDPSMTYFKRVGGKEKEDKGDDDRYTGTPEIPRDRFDRIPKIPKKPYIPDVVLGDLKIEIVDTPRYLHPGVQLGDHLKVDATCTFKNGIEEKVAVDVFLSTDRNYPTPPPYARYHRTFREDVLLRGGREHIGFNSDTTKRVKMHGSNTIPYNTPEGKYFLGVSIDAGDKIDEQTEENNVDFIPVTIRSKRK